MLGTSSIGHVKLVWAATTLKLTMNTMLLMGTGLDR
jgi:hypothetical protein